jgi:cytochrome P450
MTAIRGTNGHAAHAGLGDLVRLAARMGSGWLRDRRAFDPAAVGCRWAQDILRRDGAADLEIAVLGKRLELVGDREHSERLLAGRPGVDGFVAGSPKASAMSFLAPHALTIADGDAWTRLRPFNEQVLATGVPHPYAQAFLDRVRAAFADPVVSVAAVRASMARAMVGIVLGDDAGAGAADDVRVLFDVVQRPLRRKLLGFLYKKRRQRLYDVISRRIATSRDGDRTLAALARDASSGITGASLLEQVPHWMFTFTGSGTDLLVRTLVMVSSRPDVHQRVLAELAAAGPPARAESMGHLPYLDACFLETGRLFPPVTRTFHRRASAPDGAAAREIVHYFPLLQRDERLGPTVHAFHPDRWLAPNVDAAAAASNLFLRGARVCPGRDLILFVCRSAAARQLGELGISAPDDRLARDPLPLSFPKHEPRFTRSEGSP